MTNEKNKTRKTTTKTKTKKPNKKKNGSMGAQCFLRGFSNGLKGLEGVLRDTIKGVSKALFYSGLFTLFSNAF